MPRLEDEITVHLRTSAQEFKLKHLGEQIRSALRRIDTRFDEITNSAPNSNTFITNNGGGGGGPQNVPFPMFISDGMQLFPNGILPLGGDPCRITSAEIGCDPTGDPATANTSFRIQNALNNPSSAGSVTIPSGGRRGYTNILNISFGVGQKMFVKAPSNLNGVQVLYFFRVGVEPL